MTDGPLAVQLPDDVPAACALAAAAVRWHRAGGHLRIAGPGWAADLLEGLGIPFHAPDEVLRGAGLRLGHGAPAAWSARVAGVRAYGTGGWLARWLWSGGPGDLVAPLPGADLPLAERHRAEAGSALAAAGVSGAFSVLAPRVLAGRTGREGVWPAYPLLHRLLREAGRRIVLLPGGGDPAAIQAFLPEGHLIAGLGAGATAAVLAMAVATVTDDEGIAHLGALTGAPVVVLARRPLPELAGRVTLLAGDRWPTAAQVWSQTERPR